MSIPKPLINSLVLPILLATIFLFPTISFSAWPIFEMPAAEPKAYLSIVYSSNMSISRYYKFDYDSRGNLLKKVRYDSSGNDGIWFTNDDVVGYYVDLNFYDALDRKTMEIEYSAAGPDGIPLTADDPINEYDKWLYDTNGDIYRHVKYNSPGNDGNWFTADDLVSSYTAIIYDYNNYSTRDIEYMGPGNDGTWFTADDQIEEYDDMDFHSNFRQYFEEDFNGSGPDGQWFTGDDVKREQDEWFYDGNWNLTKYIQTKTSGEIDQITYHYNDENNCTRLINKRDGSVRYYVDFVYDDQDRMKEAFQYQSPGTDGIWFTNDDTWVAKVVYDFTPPQIAAQYSMPWVSLLLLGNETRESGPLYVPGTYPNIQAAIDAAAPGDTVIVSDGVYTGAGNKNLDFRGKNIIVKSLNGPVSCIIDCEQSGRGFYFHNGETSNAVVSGFTIKNGLVTGQWPDGCGGGILCLSSSPAIRDCIIENNSSYEPGGGIALQQSSATIENCIIANNSAHSGGGILLWYSPSVIITNCIVSGNVAANIVGGIEVGDSVLTLKNSTVYGNTGSFGIGGLGCLNVGGGSGSSVNIFNSIFWANVNGEIDFGNPSTVTVTYSDIQGGFSGTGNINQDPLFVDDVDFRLTASSPCIDSGTSEGASNTDIEGVSRPQGSGYDMGAYEYH